MIKAGRCFKADGALSAAWKGRNVLVRLERILKRILVHTELWRVLHGSMCLCLMRNPLLETVVLLVCFLAVPVSTDIGSEIPLHMGPR